MMDLYAEVGVGKEASKEQIKKAYRKRSKETHPDLHPGDDAAKEKFGALTKAYGILSDDEKRRRYDAGEDPEKISKVITDRDIALASVLQLFFQVLEQMDPDHNNVFAVMTQMVSRGIQGFHCEIDLLEKKNKKLEKIKGRISNTKGQENIFVKSLEATIRGNKDFQETQQKQIRIAEISIEIIDDYKYEVAPVIFTWASFGGVLP